MEAEQAFREKPRKIEALHAGAATRGRTVRQVLRWNAFANVWPGPPTGKWRSR